LNRQSAAAHHQRLAIRAVRVTRDVHGVTMISSPGSGVIAPTQVCIAAVPDVTVIAYLTPFLLAKLSRIHEFSVLADAT